MIYILLKKLGTDRRNEQDLAAVRIGKSENFENHKHEISEKRIGILKLIGILSSLSALCVSGAIFPSPVNFVYFIAFLSIATFISWNLTLFKKFALLLKGISLVILTQLTCIVLYQSPWAYSLFEGQKFIMNMLGFNRILLIDDKKHFTKFQVNWTLDKDLIFLPLALIITYFVLITTANYIVVGFVWIIRILWG